MTEGRSAMNQRCIAGFLGATAISLFAMPDHAIAQSLKGQLVGSWIFVSNEQTRSDGSKVQGYGAEPKGINIFSADGRFVVLFLRGDLPKLANSKATPEEAKAIVAGSIGYFGTYTVDEPNKTIHYHVEGTTFPNQRTEQRRVISLLTDKELRYRNPGPTTAAQIEVVLKRAN
jgi:hypothetical protein